MTAFQLILKTFIQLAANKVTAAQQKADEVQSSIEATASGAVDDLEATETPESILLATVSGEQSRDRTDRAIVTPWLKFLWEAYRTVLDILRNNARLEILYQSTAMQAFDFCLQYTRKTEFRRLCELLRNHVQTAAKYSAQMHAINLNDPDTLQRHLETRFQQLNVAVELDLWQEAFRSVEDIHTLLNLSKRPPKNIMMANYYEKLTRIFLVGENYLFHAAAWARYYNLLRQSAALVSTGQGKKTDNPPASEADMQRAASFVVLSALSIPVISTSRSRGAMVDFDEAKKNKNSRLTHLLGMSQAPTRAGLFQDALSKALLRRARAEIRDLYNILEVDFHPLSICNKISPILVKIGGDPDMQKYIIPLQQVILTRLFQQLSQVYDTVALQFVETLADFPEPFQVSRATIEKFIMNGNKKGDLVIRMNHASGVLSFDTDVFSSAKAAHAGPSAGSVESETKSVQRLQSTPSEIVKSQLTRLGKSLFVTCFYVDPTFNQSRIAARNEALARAKEGVESERRAILARKEVIQKRKDAASELQAQKEKEMAKQKRIREEELKALEKERLAREQRERDERRRKQEHEKVRLREVEQTLAELKLGSKSLDIDLSNIEELDTNRIRALKLAQLEREKSDVNERLRITGKRLDHLERAYRKEEAKKLADDYKQQRERDLAAYERKKETDLENAEIRHKESVGLKHRLTRLFPHYEEFRRSLHERRREEFDKRRRDAERGLEKAIAARKREFRENKLREKREREEKERQLREAEERSAREEEERRQREEARRADMARLKEERERQRQETAELAARQQQREEEAMARRKAEKERAAAEARQTRALESAPRPIATGDWRERDGSRSTLRASNQPPSRTGTPMERTDSGSGAGEGRRLLDLPGARGWREREAAKKAAGIASTEGSNPPAPPRSGPGSASMERTDLGDRSGGPPPLRLAGGKQPAWRERAAAKKAAGATETITPSGRPGKFILPQLRNKENSGA